MKADTTDLQLGKHVECIQGGPKHAIEFRRDQHVPGLQGRQQSGPFRAI